MSMKLRAAASREATGYLGVLSAFGACWSTRRVPVPTIADRLRSRCRARVQMFIEIPKDPVLAVAIAEGPVRLDTPCGREAFP
jgi:hypothetical protein